ncbi:MAG TPA: hypothetical protein VF220_00910 [Nitrososphaeraceae archaeon]
MNAINKLLDGMTFHIHDDLAAVIHRYVSVEADVIKGFSNNKLELAFAFDFKY